MSILDTLKADLDRINKAVQKDEAWVVAEFNKGWQLLETIGHTAEVDIKGVFDYIAAHQQTILNNLQSILGGIGLVAGIVPATSPLAGVVEGALTAINAATAATNVLGSHMITGATPLTVAQSAFHALKDAQTAVNGVIKQASSKPATKPAATPVVAPVVAVAKPVATPVAK